MVRSDDRPADMSRLDWLWETYRGYNVTDELPEGESPSLLLTDSAVRRLVRDASGGLVATLRLVDDPDDGNAVRLVGYSPDGEAVTGVAVPREDHIESLSCRKVTEGDGDCGYAVGTRVLAVGTRLGKVYMVSCAEMMSGLISSDEGNLIRQGSDGGLYAADEWHFVD